MTVEEQLNKLIQESLKQSSLATGTIDNSNGTVVCFTKAFYTTRIPRMNFYNSVAYKLTVRRYDSVNNTISTEYSFDIAAGNKVENTDMYILSEGDYIILMSDVPGTTYEVQYTTVPLVPEDQRVIVQKSRTGSNIRHNHISVK